jgi:hypothetical protein
MIRAIQYLEAKLKELYEEKLPNMQELAQEQIYTIDDIEEALRLLKEVEGIE